MPEDASGAGSAPADRFAAGPVVTVFRSRLRPENREEYGDEAAQMAALARRMPGLIDFKTFTADDGERITIVTFADEASQAAWRRHADHVVAQRHGRASYYAEYSLQVCETQRVRGFVAPAEAAEAAGTTGSRGAPAGGRGVGAGG